MNSRIIKVKEKIGFISSAAVGGYEESRGPFGDRFDLCDRSDRFSQSTWEAAEAEMSRTALNIALGKANLSHKDIDLLVSGDLQNQCVASSGGLFGFGIPYIGVYGACSTCTESLMTLTSFLTSSEKMTRGAVVTSSHNSAAERQFRTPIEYGAVRPASAQWTATASGAFILEKGRGKAHITEYMPGRMIDGATTDGANMGAAMAFAAADSIISYFENTGLSPDSFDYIVTGDLGKVGSGILREILHERCRGAERRHADCGLLLYDFQEQDAHSGASGCGTSASILSVEFLPAIERGEIKNILFLSTGALMSPSSILHGENIIGIAPLIRIEGSENQSEG